MAIGNFLKSFLSFGSPVNIAKSGEQETEEGIASPLESVLTLTIEDDELIRLKKKWEQKWESSEAKKDIEIRQNENERYWKGDHYTQAQKKTGKREPIDNLIFESLETALPVYTRQIAEPLVTSSEEPEAQAFSRKVADRIVDVADTIRLRLKIRKAVRYWAIYFLGCIKIGWSETTNEMAVQTLRPQSLVLDPDAITDECEYEGDYLGHYRKESAEKLILRFPNKKDEILKIVSRENLGTKIRFCEWWTADYLFWTLKDSVLGKSKNPHWNYGENEINFFANRKIPFGFLSVFNLGKSPYDETGLIEQVLPTQDIVNKRVRQIDRNADSTNGGIVVSGDVFTKEQAKEVTDALRKGTAIWVPKGDVNRAYKRDQGQPLPNFIYESLVDSRNEIRGVFGVTGLTPQGIQKEQTVRGKIIIGTKDTDRAASIVDQIEQLYDYIFNWFVQMMVVYYDTPRQVSRTQGSDTIISSDFVHPLVVSVKEGSLIPKDRLVQRNEAIDLWSAGAMDPLTLAERLEMPNPQEFVRRLILWKTNPIALSPELQQQQAGMQGGMPGEGEQPILPQQSEVPPEGQSNLLNQVPIFQ